MSISSKSKGNLVSVFSNLHRYMILKYLVYRKQALKIERFERSTGKRKCQQQGLCGVVFRKPLTLLPDRAPSNTQGQSEQQETSNNELPLPLQTGRIGLPFSTLNTMY